MPLPWTLPFLATCIPLPDLHNFNTIISLRNSEFLLKNTKFRFSGKLFSQIQLCIYKCPIGTCFVQIINPSAYMFQNVLHDLTSVFFNLIFLFISFFLWHFSHTEFNTYGFTFPEWAFILSVSSANITPAGIFLNKILIFFKSLLKIHLSGPGQVAQLVSM